MDEQIPWGEQPVEPPTGTPREKRPALVPTTPAPDSVSDRLQRPPEPPAFDPPDWTPPPSSDGADDYREPLETRFDVRPPVLLPQAVRPILASQPEDGLDQLLPFDFQPEKNSSRIGILGGTNFGKTYFFQAMVYRLLAGELSGALSYYLANSDVWEFPFLEQTGKRGRGTKLNQPKFIQNYRRWIELKTTRRTEQKWYCLRLQFRSGLIGTGTSTMDVEFLDGSGEGFEQPLTNLTLPTWKAAFEDAEIIVFCLPIWAIFFRNLSKQDEKDREKFLAGFDAVLTNYLQVKKAGLKVRTILALTMADDKRFSLRAVKDRWIEPFAQHPDYYLQQMRKRSGASQYLASARAISDYLYQAFDEIGDPELRRIPQRLDLGRGRPYLIPVTALDGAKLNTSKSDPSKAPSEPPVPIHVELPLLVALCERYNILL